MMLDLETNDLQDFVIGSLKKKRERGNFPNFSKLNFESEKDKGKNGKQIWLDLKQYFYLRIGNKIFDSHVFVKGSLNKEYLKKSDEIYFVEKLHSTFKICSFSQFLHENSERRVLKYVVRKCSQTWYNFYHARARIPWFYRKLLSGVGIISIETLSRCNVFYISFRDTETSERDESI